MMLYLRPTKKQRCSDLAWNRISNEMWCHVLGASVFSRFVVLQEVFAACVRRKSLFDIVNFHGDPGTSWHVIDLHVHLAFVTVNFSWSASHDLAQRIAIWRHDDIFKVSAIVITVLLVGDGISRSNRSSSLEEYLDYLKIISVFENSNLKTCMSLFTYLRKVSWETILINLRLILNLVVRCNREQEE